MKILTSATFTASNAFENKYAVAIVDENRRVWGQYFKMTTTGPVRYERDDYRDDLDKALVFKITEWAKQHDFDLWHV